MESPFEENLTSLLFKTESPSFSSSPPEKAIDPPRDNEGGHTRCLHCNLSLEDLLKKYSGQILDLGVIYLQEQPSVTDLYHLCIKNFDSHVGDPYFDENLPGFYITIYKNTTADKLLGLHDDSLSPWSHQNIRAKSTLYSLTKRFISVRKDEPAPKLRVTSYTLHPRGAPINKKVAVYPIDERNSPYAGFVFYHVEKAFNVSEYFGKRRLNRLKKRYATDRLLEAFNGSGSPNTTVENPLNLQMQKAEKLLVNIGNMLPNNFAPITQNFSMTNATNLLLDPRIKTEDIEDLPSNSTDFLYNSTFLGEEKTYDRQLEELKRRINEEQSESFSPKNDSYSPIVQKRLREADQEGNEGDSPKKKCHLNRETSPTEEVPSSSTSKRFTRNPRGQQQIPHFCHKKEYHELFEKMEAKVTGKTELDKFAIILKIAQFIDSI